MNEGGNKTNKYFFQLNLILWCQITWDQNENPNYKSG